MNYDKEKVANIIVSLNKEERKIIYNVYETNNISYLLVNHIIKDYLNEEEINELIENKKCNKLFFISHIIGEILESFGVKSIIKIK